MTTHPPQSSFSAHIPGLLDFLCQGMTHDAYRTKSRRANISPIDRVPDELLIEFINIALALTPDAGAGPIRFSAVCTRWRNAILSTAHLWTRIRITSTTHLSKVKLQLRNSEDLPLHVSSSSCSLPIFNALIPHFPRIARLDLNNIIDYQRHWSKIAVMPAPLLHTFSLRLGGIPGQSEPKDAASRLWPRLAALSLTSDSEDCICHKVAVSSVRILNLDWSQMTTTDLYDILADVPALQHLVVVLPESNSVPRLPLRRLSTPSLLNLKSVTLKGSMTESWLNVLSSLQGPSCEHLILEVASLRSPASSMQSRVTECEPSFPHILHLSIGFTHPRKPLDPFSVQAALKDVMRWTRLLPNLRSFRMDWGQSRFTRSQSDFDPHKPLLSIMAGFPSLRNIMIGDWCMGPTDLKRAKTLVQTRKTDAATLRAIDATMNASRSLKLIIPVTSRA